ncbi:MAG: hypothetical protein AB9897_02680 [Anaerolineaceae bacterium]
MELIELEKRLEWLDSERQKSNLEITALRDQTKVLQATIDQQNQAIATLEKELKATAATTGRISQFESVLEQVKADLLKKILEVEKKHAAIMKNLEKQEKDDQNAFNKRFSELQTILPLVTEIKKSLQSRIDEESRLSQRLDAIAPTIEKMNSSVIGVTQENKRLSDDAQSTNKRMADLQVETTALRKRLEEERNRNEVSIAALQKFEASLKTLLAQEAERKQSQIAFIEKASLAQIERENIWKNWQERVAEISSLGADFSQKIAALEATHRAIKQSQNDLDEVNLRFDRRINELTEMHRLNEERFRQEWLSFKGDDQKRWTNYQLTQEEQQQDESRQQTKLLERITLLEDEIQTAKETIRLITEETEKQLKSFYSVFHDLIESFEQTFTQR